MPQTKAARKSLQRSQKRALRNKTYKSRIRTSIRKLRLAVDEGRHEDAKLALRESSSLLDKAREKGILHANNVSRRKSRLTLLLNKMETPVETG